MNRSRDLATTLSLLSGLQPQLEQLRRHLVPLLAELPLPHSEDVKTLHAAVDKAIRAGVVVQSRSPSWAHLVSDRQRRA